MAGFDVAIIGGGSAGCALAGRLAARTDLRIALVEAGPDYGPRSGGGWPSELLDAHHTSDSHDWGYAQSRARVIGGCSTHNEAALVRALPGDYDAWAVPGWADADLAPLIEGVARAVPTRVCRPTDLAAWQRSFLEAAVAEGFPLLRDADASPGAHGVAPFVQNVKDDVRWNAAFTFLDPVRPRVTVLGGLLADRLVLERGRALVLIAHDRDGPREISAERFVLCAGVYGSPAILMRSGVGPTEHLRKRGIRVETPLRGVGANLHDHPGVGFEYEPTARARRAARDDEASGRFQESQVVLRAAPDLHVVPYQTHDEGTWSFGILVYCMSPRSRGHVRLTGRDPAAPPEIEPALLSDRGKHDLDALIDGVDLVHRLTGRAPLADAIARGPRRFKARARRARFVRGNVTDYSHPVGTCRMGALPQDGDVVDARGRVHGLANVFVADASVFPRIPRANVNLTCYVIGVRMADLL